MQERKENRAAEADDAASRKQLAAPWQTTRVVAETLARVVAELRRDGHEEAADEVAKYVPEKLAAHISAGIPLLCVHCGGLDRAQTEHLGPICYDCGRGWGSVATSQETTRDRR